MLIAVQVSMNVVQPQLWWDAGDMLVVLDLLQAS